MWQWQSVECDQQWTAVNGRWATELPRGRLSSKVKRCQGMSGSVRSVRADKGVDQGAGDADRRWHEREVLGAVPARGGDFRFL